MAQGRASSRSHQGPCQAGPACEGDACRRPGALPQGCWGPFCWPLRPWIPSGAPPAAPEPVAPRAGLVDTCHGRSDVHMVTKTAHPPSKMAVVPAPAPRTAAHFPRRSWCRGPAPPNPFPGPRFPAPRSAQRLPSSRPQGRLCWSLWAAPGPQSSRPRPPALEGAWEGTAPPGWGPGAGAAGSASDTPKLGRGRHTNEFPVQLHGECGGLCGEEATGETPPPCLGGPWEPWGFGPRREPPPQRAGGPLGESRRRRGKGQSLKVPFQLLQRKFA